MAEKEKMMFMLDQKLHCKGFGFGNHLPKLRRVKSAAMHVGKYQLEKTNH